MCILLVEDEWLICSMVAELLMDGGFVVHEAEDGDHAAVPITRDPSAYTLLVTDIHMPGSLDGLGVAQLVRALRLNLPVIYTTGWPDVLNHLQPLGPGKALLQKPFVLSDLMAAAWRMLGHAHWAPSQFMLHCSTSKGSLWE